MSERKVPLLSSRAESRDDNSLFFSYASTPLSVTDRVFVQTLNRVTARIMEKFKKILILKNEIEAKLLESILKDRAISHVIKSYHDSALDGLFQLQQGWGHLEAAISDRAEIKSIYDDLPNQ